MKEHIPGSCHVTRRDPLQLGHFFLKQAFTEPELWPVAADRLDRLVSAGHINQETATQFAKSGAAGSHLEVLQRWEGFKGFNKTGVSRIIRDTDARRSV